MVASPGRSARFSDLPGHRQRSPNSAALTVGRLASLAPGAARKDQRNLAAITHIRCPYARARGWAARCCSTCSGRRSGCWPHAGEVAGGAVADFTLVIFRFGATMELGRSGRSMMMMTSASASGGDGGVAGSLSEVQRPTGSSTAIAKFCSTDGRALGFARAGRGSERSAEFGSVTIFAALTRAR